MEYVDGKKDIMIREDECLHAEIYAMKKKRPTVVLVICKKWQPFKYNASSKLHVGESGVRNREILIGEDEFFTRRCTC